MKPRPPRLELLLFSTDMELVASARRSGIDGVIVDLDRLGKHERQESADTQVNCHSLDDLRRVRRATDINVICRINNSPGCLDEAETALRFGADEILLPMIQSVSQVERLLDRFGPRRKIGVMVETVAAVRLAGRLGELPIARAWVGLNDLAIERGTPSIFTSLADGTVDRIRTSFRAPFAVGGLTLPDKGHPVPCRLLIGEMARLGCQFAILRRSFLRDVQDRVLDEEIERIKNAMATAHARDNAAAERDRKELRQCVRALGRWPAMDARVPGARADAGAAREQEA